MGKILYLHQSSQGSILKAPCLLTKGAPEEAIPESNETPYKIKQKGILHLFNRNDCLRFLAHLNNPCRELF